MEFPHRAFADAAPRRTGASSITSSWYSVARWVSSTTAAARTTAIGPAVAELSGQRGQQRAEPLPAGLDQMLGGLGQHRVRGADGVAQGVFDPLEAGLDGRFEHGIVESDADRCAEPPPAGRTRCSANRCHSPRAHDATPVPGQAAHPARASADTVGSTG